MLSHTQSVNSICSLGDANGITVTASSDKTIKLWKPTSETIQNIQEIKSIQQKTPSTMNNI